MRGKYYLGMLWWVMLLAVQSRAAEVSVTPPGIYESEVAPLLTPMEEILAEKDPHLGKDDPGTVRWMETITRVEDDGTYLRALRYVYQPYSEKGAEVLATDRFRYQSRMEKIHLVRARTILPDGSEKAPGPNAVFTQKGSKASGSIYDDGEDLVVVFPDVKPGVICEVVVVFERMVPSVRDGHGETFHWTAGWPVGGKRHVVDVPASWKGRLNAHTIGRGPEMKSLPAVDGRLRMEWRHGPIDAWLSEPNMAPVTQTGPMTWLTTFADWDEVAAWYQTLLDGRGELGDKLKSRVDEWTVGVATPREILNVLYDKVANDVRYEGLSFGISGLQPYACDTVWENQYGDCKDKSNLLVAMLRHKGIKAHLALVNTRHVGLVRRNIPDFRHFDHAILVVSLSDRETVFCDPTIQHGRPGMLAPSSAARDLLVIDDGKATWMKSPDADAGVDHYAFDMEMDETGRLSGWLTMRSTGFYAIGLADSLAGVDRDTASRRLRDRVSGFIVGAEVVDFVLPEQGREIDETVVKVYFTGSPRPRDGGERLSLLMPSSSALYNDFGDGKNRRTSYSMWPDRIQVETKVRLPDGWAAEALPAPLHLETPHYEVTSQWEQTNGHCVGALDLKCKVPVIPAVHVAAASRVNRTLFSWLEVPLLLKEGAKAAVTGKSPEIRMPVMPTGEGQLELVNRWYPREGDAAPRKEALQQVLRDFPEEAEAVFDARVELAYLLYRAKDFKEALAAFEQLGSRPPSGVSPESVGYACYFQALTLQKLKRTDEALEIMRTLAADKTLSNHRRSWAATTAGEWMTSKEEVTDEAVELLEFSVKLKEESADSALDLLVSALAKSGNNERLVELLADSDAFALSSDEGAEAIRVLTERDAAQTLEWLTAASELADDAQHKELLEKARAKLDSAEKGGKIREEIRLKLVELIKRERPKDFREGAIPKDATVAETETRLNELAPNDRTAWRGVIASYFERFPSAPEFSHQLWQYISHLSTLTGAQKDDEAGRYFEEVLELGERLPTEDGNYWEIQFVKAHWLAGKGRLEEAEVVYRAMPDHPDFDQDFNHAAVHRLGVILERRGKWDEAIGCYLKFKDSRRDFPSVAEHLLRAGVLMVLSDREAEALETWKLLTDVPPRRYADSVYQNAILEAIALAEDPEAALAQWKRTKFWWKRKFVPLHALLGGGPLGDPHPFFIEEVDDLNTRDKRAVKEQDIKTIAHDFARVATTARVLPEYVQYFQQMDQLYVRPLRPQAGRAIETSIADLAAVSWVGLQKSRENCLRVAAAFRLDLGRPSFALNKLKDAWKPEGGGSAEHRERSGWVYCSAVLKEGKDLDNAIACADHFIKHGMAFFPESQWFGMYADLLNKADRKPEAIKFLKSAAKRDSIKNDDSQLAAVNAKIAELQKPVLVSQDLGKAAAGLLKKFRPDWYEHVGPKDLSDPRMSKPEQLLQEKVEGFHKTELFRAWMLLALSDETEAKFRQEALILAAAQAGLWQRDAKAAVDLWKVLLDDSSITHEMRLQLLWRAANALSMHGFVKELAELKACEVFGGFASAYKNVYFPILEGRSRLMADPDKSAKAEVKSILKVELDEMGLSLATQFHASLLYNGRDKEAEEMRKALHKWKLAPAIESKRNATRLDWSRLAGRSSAGLKARRILLDIAGDSLRANAEGAPPSWYSRMDVEKMNDLPGDVRDAIIAKRLMTGLRHDQTTLDVWSFEAGAWLEDLDGELDQKLLLKAVEALQHINDDNLTCWLLLGIQEHAGSLDDWTEMDARLKFFKGNRKFPATSSVIRIWETFRNFKAGDEVDVAGCLGWISSMPYRPPFYAGLLEALVLNDDEMGLKRVLDEVDAEYLTDGSAISTYHEVLDFLGREEELEILDSMIDDIIHKLMQEAWLTASSWDFCMACDYANRFGKEELLPEDFLQKVPKNMGDPQARLRSEAYAFAVAGKWDDVKTTLEKVVDKDIRDGTDWKYLMGKTHLKLGDVQNARKHLQDVCECPLAGNAEILAARKLLAELDQAN